MATVTKRPGSTMPWQVRWRDHNGKSKSAQFTRKRDADAHALDVERAKQTGRLDLLDSGTQTLAEIGAEYFRLHKSEWEPVTAKGLAYVWNAAVEGQPSKGSRTNYPRAAIADMQVRTIRRSHVQGFKVDAQAAGVPFTSIRRALSLISRSLDYAADEGIIGANPAAGVKPPAGPHRPDVYVVSPGQVEAVRAAMKDERDRLIVSVMAYAGLRPQELRALDARHVGKTLRVESACRPDGTLKRLKGTGGEKRNVPLCDALAADFKAFGAKGLIFTSATGGAMTKTDWDNWRKRKFVPAAEKAKVPIKIPYSLRHSIASLWLREGIDRVTVAQRLGHSVMVLERHYAHVIADLDPKDRRTVDELIAEARSSKA